MAILFTRHLWCWRQLAFTLSSHWSLVIFSAVLISSCNFVSSLLRTFIEKSRKKKHSFFRFEAGGPLSTVTCRIGLNQYSPCDVFNIFRDFQFRCLFVLKFASKVSADLDKGRLEIGRGIEKFISVSVLN